MKTRGRARTIALGIAAATVACGQGKVVKASASQDIPNELFDAAPAGVREPHGRGVGRTNFCFADDAASILFPGAGIGVVTGSLPFRPHESPGPRHCTIMAYSEPIMPTAENMRTFRYSDCSVAYIPSQGEPRFAVYPNRRIEAASADRFRLSECIYRLAMFIEGYRGALTVSSRRLFGSAENYGPFASVRNIIGPLATNIPQRLSLNCPDLIDMYYRENTSEMIKARCIQNQ